MLCSWSYICSLSGLQMLLAAFATACTPAWRSVLHGMPAHGSFMVPLLPCRMIGSRATRWLWGRPSSSSMPAAPWCAQMACGWAHCESCGGAGGTLLAAWGSMAHLVHVLSNSGEWFVMLVVTCALTFMCEGLASCTDHAGACGRHCACIQFWCMRGFSPSIVTGHTCRLRCLYALCCACCT